MSQIWKSIKVLKRADEQQRLERDNSYLLGSLLLDSSGGLKEECVLRLHFAEDDIRNGRFAASAGLLSACLDGQASVVVTHRFKPISRSLGLLVGSPSSSAAGCSVKMGPGVLMLGVLEGTRLVREH